MIRFAAINSSPDGGSKKPRTHIKGKDALEAENFALYEKALHHQYAGQYQDAEKLYKNILASPLLVLNEVSQRDDIYYTLPVVTLQYLAYKNFASLCEATSRKTEALEYYAKALDVDGRDVVVWYQMAVICIAIGRLQLARYALEQGLKACPDHWLSVDKLSEVQFILGDFGACMNSIDKMLEMEPNFNKAILLKAKILEENPDNIFKVEALLWEAGGNDIDAARINELAQVRHKRQKVANWDQQDVTVPNREFALKDITWNSLTDLLYSIYKEMSLDDGKSQFLNDPIYITTPNLPPTPSGSPIAVQILNDDSNSLPLPSPPQPNLNASNPNLVTPSLNFTSAESNPLPTTSDTNTTPGTTDMNSSSSGLGNADAEIEISARPKHPRGKKTGARQSTRVKDNKLEKPSELDDYISKLISWKDESGSNEKTTPTIEMNDDADVEDRNYNPTPPPYTAEDEKKQVLQVMLSLQNRMPALRGIVDWIIAFLSEICERLSHNWTPGLAPKIMGLQAIAHRHSTWFKKYYLTIAELHFDAHACNVTSIGHQIAPTFTPALHLAENSYYSGQIFAGDYSSLSVPHQIRAMWLKAISCIQADEHFDQLNVPMAMECMEGCKKLLTENNIDIVWIAHCTHNRSITVRGIDRKVKEVSGLNTVSAATDLFSRENYKQVVALLQSVANTFTEFPLEEPDGKHKDVTSSKRNRLRIYDLLHLSYLKLKDIKNAFWCLERILAELLPHCNMPEMQGNVQSLLDYVLATEKIAESESVPLSSFNLTKLKRGIAFLIKRSSPYVVVQGVKVFYELHSEQMSLGQKIVLQHLIHNELAKKKSCHHHDNGKFLRKYVSLLVLLAFPTAENENLASKDDWDLLKAKKIDIDLELAQCFYCLYGIKLQSTTEEHPPKNQQQLRAGKEVVLLFLLLRQIYQEYKQKPPKETKDALAKLYSLFKDPPERVTPMRKDLERYLTDIDKLPQQTIIDLKAARDDKVAQVHSVLKKWSAHEDTEDMDLGGLTSDTDCDYIYDDLYLMVSYSESDTAYEELIKKDLYCNPWRIDSWVVLGMLHLNKLSAIIEEEAIYFPYQPALVPQVEILSKVSDRCLSQAIELDGSREDLWKVLGLLLYQLHKFIPLPSYPLASATTPAPIAPSSSSSPSPTLSNHADNSNGSSSSNDQVPESSEITQERQQLVALAYKRSAECFSRARVLNQKEWLYLPNTRD